MTIADTPLTGFFRAATLALVSILAACATTTRIETVAGIIADDCVVLLHGANRSWRAMRPMAEALQDAGYTTVNVDYPSRSGTVDELADLAVLEGVEGCRATGATRIHFVTHSLGGILLRYAQAESPIAEIGRAVMLGPPNLGSEVVDRTENLPGASVVGSEALLQLGTGEDDLPASLPPVDFEVGIVAGTGTINPWMSAMLPDPDDGKVSASRTRVAGMSDFLLVDDNHRHIVEDEVVIRNTVAFLRNGSFIDADRKPLPENLEGEP